MIRSRYRLAMEGRVVRGVARAAGRVALAVAAFGCIALLVGGAPQWARAADVNGTITAGGSSVAVTLSTPGDVGYLTFSGTAGERVFVKAVTGTLSPSNGASSPIAKQPTPVTTRTSRPNPARWRSGLAAVMRGGNIEENSARPRHPMTWPTSSTTRWTIRRGRRGSALGGRPTTTRTRTRSSSLIRTARTAVPSSARRAARRRVWATSTD